MEDKDTKINDLVSTIKKSINIANQYISNEAAFEIKEPLKNVLEKYNIKWYE